MPFALKVGQRTHLHVTFLREDGIAGIVATPPTWTSSNSAMVAIVADPLSTDGCSVYVECLGPVDPDVTSPVVQIACAGEADLGTGGRIVQALPFDIQPEAAEVATAVITADVPEPILAS